MVDALLTLERLELGSDARRGLADRRRDLEVIQAAGVAAQGEDDLALDVRGLHRPAIVCAVVTASLAEPVCVAPRTLRTALLFTR